MKLAWLTRGPQVGGSSVENSKASVPLRGDKPPNLRIETLNTRSANAAKAPVAQTTSPVSVFQKLASSIKSLFQPSSAAAALKQPFVLPEHAQLKQQAETYAESPFEKTLFEKALAQFGKKQGSLAVSKAWGQAILGADTQVQEEALTLLKGYLAYSANGNVSELSAHTQMKLMIFSPHLSEGAVGRATLYEAILKLPLSHLMEFAAFLKKDFSTLPAIVQALLMKQLLQLRKDLKLDKKDELSPDELAFKKMVKQLVVKFYSEKSELQDAQLAQHEKIRVGFLKIRPIEEAYHEQLEEIEKKYRLKLRQLKKRRSQNVAESEEERLRRIEMVYDTVEDNLVTGLTELTTTLDQVQAG